jgi:hypothetical protein
VHREIHQRARGFLGDDLEMNRVAADHTSQGDRRVIGFSARLGCIERDCNRGRYFQGAGNRDDVMADASRLQFGNRAFQQRVLDVVVKARLDDQRPRAGNISLVLQRSASRVCHHSSTKKFVIAGRKRGSAFQSNLPGDPSC